VLLTGPAGRRSTYLVTVNVLSVQAAHLDLSDRRSRPGEDVYAWLEWMVGGKSIRSKDSQAGTEATDITMLQARDFED
jgi:hypothetical protein